MNGFKKLSSDVREEMLTDAKDFMRGLAQPHPAKTQA